MSDDLVQRLRTAAEWEYGAAEAAILCEAADALEQAERERDEWEKTATNLLKRAEQAEREANQQCQRAIDAERERDEARALLREREWSQSSDYCSTCHCYRDEGHAPDCRLDAALKVQP